MAPNGHRIDRVVLALRPRRRISRRGPVVCNGVSIFVWVVLPLVGIVSCGQEIIRKVCDKMSDRIRVPPDRLLPEVLLGLPG